MKSFKKQIDRQLEFNQGKNLFCFGNVEMHFIPETLKAIEQIGGLDPVSEQILIDYTTDKVLQELYRINQYYSFNQKAQLKLKGIYRELFSHLKSREFPVDQIAKAHYESLTNWLNETNPFAGKIYSKKPETIEPVTCAEYSAEMQLEVLHLKVSEIVAPVLDIGCGKNGNLVTYLRLMNIEAYGIDRLTDGQSFLERFDWLEYEYGIEKWGTIVSNLGFSNHFKHHHFRDDGNFILYAKKYMEILNSLKSGGSFCYAPDLSFIEPYLNSATFQVIKNQFGEFGYNSTVITRL